MTPTQAVEIGKKLLFKRNAKIEALTRENKELKLESKTMKEINVLLRDEGPKMCKELKELQEKLAKNNLKLDEKVAKKYTWDTIMDMEKTIKTLEDRLRKAEELGSKLLKEIRKHSFDIPIEIIHEAIDMGLFIDALQPKGEGEL